MEGVSIHRAKTADDFAQARALCTEFLKYMLMLYADSPHLTGEYYDPAEWSRQLAGIEAECTPPRGACLLAIETGTAIGCASLVRFGSDQAELKRMFIAEQYRGRGVGGALCRAAIAEAKRLEFKTMRLDTGNRMLDAQALYKKLGFEVCQPYYSMSQDLAGALVFMTYDLSRRPSSASPTATTSI